MINRPFAISFWTLTLSVAVVAVSVPSSSGRGGLAGFLRGSDDSSLSQNGREPETPVTAKTRLVVDRIQRKQAIAHEVVAGRMTLLDAAARYRQLHAGDPLRFLQAEEGATEEDLYCRNVINFVRYSGPTAAAPEAAAAADRLERELAQLRSNRKVVPQVAP